MLALNTKPVGYGGVASFVVGLLCFGPFQDALTKVVTAPVAQYLGVIFIVAGFAATYFGMPWPVPSNPAPAPAADPPQKAA